MSAFPVRWSQARTVRPVTASHGRSRPVTVTRAGAWPTRAAAGRRWCRSSPSSLATTAAKEQDRTLPFSGIDDRSG